MPPCTRHFKGPFHRMLALYIGEIWTRPFSSSGSPIF